VGCRRKQSRRCLAAYYRALSKGFATAGDRLGGRRGVRCDERDGQGLLLGLARNACSGGPGQSGDLAGYANLGAIAPGQAPLYEAEALTGASVALFTGHDLLRVLRGLEAGTLLAVTEVVNSLWSAMVHRYPRYLVMPLRERLNDILAELARRYGTRTDQGALRLPELGQEALAEMIGGSRPM
jgi:hypothetical protein